MAPIARDDANRLVKMFHYSKSVTLGSQLHLGVFFNGRLEGAMQFGSPVDKRKVIGFVADTKWNGFLELNRMAFGPNLPRNSESRALSIAFRIIRKAYPHIEWILSYADGTQCGDGTIYRASGFCLTGVKINKTLLRLPDGKIVTDKTLNSNPDPNQRTGAWIRRGAQPLPGFQIRYIYFLNPEARKRLTLKELPFSEIERIGAKMYLGKRAGSKGIVAAPDQGAEGGGIPTSALQPILDRPDSSG